MTQHKINLIFSVLLAVAIFSHEAYGAYRIILKNGSTIVVEDYTRTDHKIRFYRSGGFMELDESDIKEIKETKEKIREKEEVNTGTIMEQSIEKAPEPQEVINLEVRLEEIRAKKESLKAEAENITKELEKLKQEIKREGRVLALRKKRKLEEKRREIEKRIQSINDEIERLDNEEESLLKKGGY